MRKYAIDILIKNSKLFDLDARYKVFDKNLAGLEYSNSIMTGWEIIDKLDSIKDEINYQYHIPSINNSGELVAENGMIIASKLNNSSHISNICEAKVSVQTDDLKVTYDDHEMMFETIDKHFFKE